MDGAVDLYVAVPLLFTVLAVILASVFVRLRSSEEDKAKEPAAKEEGETKASAAAGDRTDGEALLKDEGEPEAAGAEPRKEKGEEEEEEAVISREAGRDAVEEIGAAEEEEEGTNEEKEEGLREKGKGEVVEDEAAPEAVKAEKRSHVQVERKVPGQAEWNAVVAAPVALEEQEEDEEEEDEEEDDEEEEEEESKEEDQESENEKLVVKEPETEDADEKFSFKYSPGKLRGNQYKTMMTKEELEEEQRTEDYMKLSLDSS